MSNPTPGPVSIDISQVPKGIRYPAYYAIAFPDEGADPHNAKLPKHLPPRLLWPHHHRFPRPTNHRHSLAGARSKWVDMVGSGFTMRGSAVRTAC